MRSILRTARRGLGPTVVAATLGLAAMVPAQARMLAAGLASDDPDWRFTHHERRVKVVLLAGSIGVFRDQPYPRLLHEWCANAEIRNLSRVSQGTPQLSTRFRREVVENPNVPMGGRGQELWVMFGGGLNSVGHAHQTNRALRSIHMLAHRRRIGRVTLSVTPWGSAEDTQRWSGARGVHLLRSTRAVVDFALGRSTPADALGPYRQTRRGVAPDGAWLPEERADVAVDLYDSRLRDRDAEPWPLERVRDQLRRDTVWRNMTATLSEADRQARLEADATALAQAPRWFLRPEYRGFDHTHPNRAGHRVIAETVCPALPASWGCTCPGASR